MALTKCAFIVWQACESEYGSACFVLSCSVFCLNLLLSFFLLWHTSMKILSWFEYHITCASSIWHVLARQEPLLTKISPHLMDVLVDTKLYIDWTSVDLVQFVFLKVYPSIHISHLWKEEIFNFYFCQEGNFPTTNLLFQLSSEMPKTSNNYPLFPVGVRYPTAEKNSFNPLISIYCLVKLEMFLPQVTKLLLIIKIHLI